MTTRFPTLHESDPRQRDPRCHKCGAPLGDDDRAEVYLDTETLRFNAGGQWVLVDDMPDSAFGPFIVHADPCSMATDNGRPTYTLA